MTAKFTLRVRSYKEFLRKKIAAIKGARFAAKLAIPKAKEFEGYLNDFYPGLACKNTARDIHALTNAGPHYDVEFHFLYLGMTSIDFIDRYNDKFLSSLVSRVFTPADVYRQFGELKRQSTALRASR